MALVADKRLWPQLQQRGMASNVSWGRSAAGYADLYRALAKTRSGASAKR
jgi:glycogen synthase